MEWGLALGLLSIIYVIHRAADIYIHDKVLKDLCFHLQGRYETQSTSRMRTCSFIGRFLGRRFTVTYRYRTFQWDRQEELEIRIPVVQKFWLRMLGRADDSKMEGEITINDPVINSFYFTNSNNPQAARLFLESEDSGKAFRSVRRPFGRLEIYRGNLSVQFSNLIIKEMIPGDLEHLLELLYQLASAYERQSIALTTVTALSDAEEMCPYCRSELASGDQIVMCPQCRTRMHDACWKENGQCTTWGCACTNPMQG